MRIKAIEKSSGVCIATASSFKGLLEQAASRRVTQSNMLFVVGDTDIQVYDYAREWVGRYTWLTQLFIELGSQEYLVEAAKSRLELWKIITDSRVVEHECDVAPSLSFIIGNSLAEGVDKLIRMDKASDCKVFGPDVKRSWADARIKAIGFSRRYESRNYVLAVHEELGAVVVAPDYMIESTPGFKIKSYFQAGRSL